MPHLPVVVRVRAQRPICLWAFAAAPCRRLCPWCRRRRARRTSRVTTTPWVLAVRVRVVQVRVVRVLSFHASAPALRVLAASLALRDVRVTVMTATRLRAPPSPSRTNRSVGGSAAHASQRTDGDVDSVWGVL